MKRAVEVAAAGGHNIELGCASGQCNALLLRETGIVGARTEFHLIDSNVPGLVGFPLPESFSPHFQQPVANQYRI